MQRRETGPVSGRVRTVVEQELRKRPVPKDSGQHERGRAIQSGIIDVRPVIQQGPHRCVVVFTHRKQQRCVPPSRLDPHVGASPNEHALDLRVPGRRGPHQRRLSVRCVLHADAGTTIQQRLCHLDSARSGGEHQWGRPVLVSGIRIGAGAQQTSHHRRAAVRGSQQERDHAVVVRGVHTRARVD